MPLPDRCRQIADPTADRLDHRGSMLRRRRSGNDVSTGRERRNRRRVDSMRATSAGGSGIGGGCGGCESSTDAAIPGTVGAMLVRSGTGLVPLRRFAVGGLPSRTVIQRGAVPASGHRGLRRPVHGRRKPCQVASRARELVSSRPFCWRRSWQDTSHSIRSSASSSIPTTTPWGSGIRGRGAACWLDPRWLTCWRIASTSTGT